MNAGKSACPQGAAIAKGHTVRLFHTATKKWLHSHLQRSPLTGQQEVSAYGNLGNSDTGDYWTVTWDGSSATWTNDAKVRMRLLCCDCLKATLL
jgi:dolichyl-phosphate-mannose--protein O-mannosyl transferase